MDFFTADWHLFHRKIIDYCNRPFKSDHAMMKAIIKRHNEVVSPDDITYVLGDLTMCSKGDLSRLEPVLSRMNGTKHLILGNHDGGDPFNYERFGFTTVHTALRYNDDIILRHDPAATNVMPDKFWLVGHVHNLFKFTTDPIRCYNVGVDVNDFYPVTLEHIYKEMGEDKGGYKPEAPPPTEWVGIKR